MILKNAIYFNQMEFKKKKIFLFIFYNAKMKSIGDFKIALIAKIIRQILS